jgi:MFS family permease
MGVRREAGAWRRPDYRRLWGAQTCGAFGAEVTELALPTVAVLHLGAGPGEVGLLVGLRWLTYPLLGPLAGLLADRLPLRRLLFAAEAGRLVPWPPSRRRLPSVS